MAAERLQKYLARAGVASRRHAEELITEGRVTVNNEKVTELGTKVSPGDLVTVDGKLVSPPEESSYFLLYKPVGVVTTLSDPQGRPTVASYIEQTGKRLFPVGRLDYDAEGALLVTDDGALAHKLTHPSFQVPRTYLAKVKGTPDAATLDKLRGGVRLEDGMATPLSVEVFEQAERNTWLKLVVAEGRPHLIKRLCAAVGYPVVRLYRPSYAGITVEGVRPGELRPLTENQVRMLQEVADGKATPPERELKLPPRRHGRSAPGFAADMDDEDFGEEAPAPVRSRAAGKPARATRTERPARKAVKTERPGKAERPARAAGRPERKEWAPRGGGGSRPAFRGAAGGRAERRTWTPREDEQEESQGEFGEEAPRREAPRREARAERGERPERREWAPRGEGRGGERGARPERKPFAGGSAERRVPARAERPERREWAPRGEERGARPERKPFGARAERPERREWAPRSEGRGGERGARPERKPFAGGGAERRVPARAERPERREWAPRGEERGARPERKPFGARAERPERREWAPRSEGRGGERGARPERKPFAGGSAERRVPARAERPERREWAPRSEGRGGERGARPERKPFAGGSAERRVPARAERPERREWAPRGEERGERGARPGPRGTGAARPARKTWGASGEDSGRPVRRGAARPEGEGAGEGSKSFVNWRTKKHQEPTPEWNARPPRGAGGPRGRGPRKGR
ncbi:RNA-binding S4 domain-containing protein [Archangium violaceum]|uniref:pseudouridine synthase n=1 Tax=Archangium violaceum TaxID=83451 RepID=UPI00193B61FC|nr:pseudouridine synthase [Archangium violaceum]QRK06593.1 RNA-binding S4 domain-containing protein [Archangium violaceum]